MKYTLITKTGKCISFYSKTVAEMYQGAYGGFIVDATLTEEEIVKDIV
jgi:hypothetical protein